MAVSQFPKAPKQRVFWVSMESLPQQTGLKLPRWLRCRKLIFSLCLANVYFIFICFGGGGLDAKMVLECRSFTLPQQFTPKYREPGNHNSGEDLLRTCESRRISLPQIPVLPEAIFPTSI